jgi:L-rhamnose mutarotase
MNNNRIIALIICWLGIASCNQSNPVNENPQMDAVKIQRFGMVTGLKAEKVKYYSYLHAHAWPAVLNQIKACHIQNYSIYIQRIDGKYFLFSYFEYSGNDFKSDMAKMAADTTTQRWWKLTDPTQSPLPEAASQNKIWENMKEVFHTN